MHLNLIGLGLLYLKKIPPSVFVQVNWLSLKSESEKGCGVLCISGASRTDH